jgi:signal transduction histidine kinase
MNQHLQTILQFIQQSEKLAADEKSVLIKAVQNSDKEFEIALFKLDRTEKVKRTTAILLEETIEELEQKRKAIEESNSALTKSLQELKAAQAQLIQSEKMASLGELTAGIAHEIQNPLNFVNNFSEVNCELSDEILEAADKGDLKEIMLLAADIKSNQEKIREHGKRADAIVKGMLQHSRTSSGDKEPTDINAVADEYLRLAYHGIRAKDMLFNAKLVTDFDESLGKVNIIPQDIGRVILNLITNAFYAVSSKTKITSDFEPTVSVRTKSLGNKIQISVADNGMGIPGQIKDKIFQPFFTTKPTGQGTGLGLSLSYDIVKAHGGVLTVETKEGEGAVFEIILPKE